ncbi:MAG TPA: hypothetical protein VIG99_16815 [Myxococcaceae bacterium]|jgi:hypothetical protein
MRWAERVLWVVAIVSWVSLAGPDKLAVARLEQAKRDCEAGKAEGCTEAGVLLLLGLGMLKDGRPACSSSSSDWECRRTLVQSAKYSERGCSGGDQGAA